MAIRDKLRELLFVEKPTVVIAEWIPFGGNQVAALNSRLGVSGRPRTTLLTGQVDHLPEYSLFEAERVHARVTVTDFDPTRFVEFTAAVEYPEAEGIVQKEEFGVHVCEQGLVVFALDLNEVEGRKERVSVDHLTRVNADLFMDSSRILETLLTHNQLRLLEAMYRGRARNRNKLVMVLGENITPRLKNAQDYDRDHRSELEQVVGTLEAAKTLSDGSLLFVGNLGLLFIAENPSRYEAALGLYLLVRAQDLFLNEYFARLWLGWDDAVQIRQAIVESERGHEALDQAQRDLPRLSADVTALEALKAYLAEAVAYTRKQLGRIGASYTPPQRELAQALGTERLFAQVEYRIADAEKVVRGLRQECEALRGLVASLAEKWMRRIHEVLKETSYSTEDLLHQVMQRVAGTYSPPLVLQLRLNAPCITERLEVWLAGKPVTHRSVKQDEESEVIRVTWREQDREKWRWLGEPPLLTLTYDAKNGFILALTAEVTDPNADRPRLRQVLLEEIRPFSVLGPSE